MQGKQATETEKSCNRCENDIWHVESNYMLQPPTTLIIYVLCSYRKCQDNVYVKLEYLIGNVI